MSEHDRRCLRHECLNYMRAREIRTFRHEFVNVICHCLQINVSLMKEQCLFIDVLKTKSQPVQK